MPHDPNDRQKTNNGCFNCGGLDHFSKNCPEPRRDRTFVRAARSAKEDRSEDEDDNASSSEEGGYISEKLASIPDEIEEGTKPDLDDRIEVEVPMGNEYYEGDESDEGMFAMHAHNHENESGQDSVAASVVFPMKGNEPKGEIKTRKHKLIPSRKTRMRPIYSDVRARLGLKVAA
jgi:hypothetical protein